LLCVEFEKFRSLYPPKEVGLNVINVGSLDSSGIRNYNCSRIAPY
jgi:hypothetical protein